MRIRALALATVFALTQAAQAQVIVGGGGSGNGNVTGPASSTNGNFPSFNGTGGKTLQDSTYSPASFAPAGVVSVVTGSNPTTNAAAWSAFTQYTIGGSGRTITLPASSGLSTNGGLDIDANTNSVTLTATSPDTITYSGATTGAGGSVTLPAGNLYRVSTDAAGKIYVSGRAVQGNGLKTQLSTGSTTTNNCVKFDANGNTVDAGAACGAGGGSGVAYAYVANGWTWADAPGVVLGTGGAPGANVITFEPFIVTATMTPSDFGLHVTTLSAGGNASVAVYANSTSWIGPTGAPLIVSNNISTASATQATAGGLSTSAQLSPGIYWRGVNVDNGTAVFKSYTNNNTAQDSIAMSNSFSNLTTNTSAAGSKITLAQTFGTWPTIASAGSFTYAAAGSSVPAVGMKIGSVP